LLRQAVDVFAVRHAFHQVTRPTLGTHHDDQEFLGAGVQALTDHLHTADRSDPDGSRAVLLTLRRLLRRHPPCRSWLIAGGVNLPALERALAALGSEE
jgi:hypothetical protein